MKTKKIKSIKKVNKEIVYDIEVGNYGHYILDGNIVSHNSFIPVQTMSGGGGITYASDYILMLSKAKHKEGDKVAGGIISSKCIKNRDVRPETKIKLLLSFKQGLHKYFGLIPYAEQAGILKKSGTKYEIVETGKKFWEKEIYGKKAEEVFTQENLEKMNKYVKEEFSYGESSLDEIIDSVGKNTEEEDSETK
jgi:hypothetical protein